MTVPPTGVFVTGCDTDVGKTVAAACLTAALGGVYWKPVQSGANDLPGGDTGVVERLLGVAPGTFPPPACVYDAPLSPDQAAALQGEAIASTRLFPPPQTDRPLVIEGAGGLMVPVNDELLMIDLIAGYRLPAALVARTGLGTINHALLSLEALRARSLPVAGVVFNGEDNPRNIEAIRRRGRVAILGRIPVLAPMTPAAVRRAARNIDLAPLKGPPL